MHFGVLQWSLLGLGLAGCIAAAGYWGVQQSQSPSEPDIMLTAMKKELVEQKQVVEAARLNAEENLNALAVRMGQMKAHVIRLDALGQRLIDKADLGKGEFDFENGPGVGGPAASHGERGQTMALEDFMASLDDLDGQLEHRSLQLGVLESMLMNQDLRDEVYPQGRPIKRGWVSSKFGYRTDPFNGRIAHHDGIDLAGKEGSDVIAVAAGVITWAGKRYGYGNLVEVNHGNGYVTRYGHNKEVSIKVGEAVKKGAVIAKMGSTGRSTGPHVHFEVIKHGRTVDPMKYIRTARK
jgi:murein DD-endopeptidase MepM/ murein hydrolase activator NlpD